MKYRKLSECMTREEVDTLMELLLPGCTIKEIQRLRESNCINITFELDGREEVLIFYPDEVENIPEDIALENQSVYQIYMIANGYSRVWEPGADMDRKEGEWILKAKHNMEDRRKKQLESDSILQALLNESEEAALALKKGIKPEDMPEKLERYLQLEEQVRERLSHTSYITGLSDTVTMLHGIAESADLANVATHLEELLIDYKNLHGLLETFGDGAKALLGDYDVTQGIYAVSTALGEVNRRLEAVFDQIYEDKTK